MLSIVKTATGPSRRHACRVKVVLPYVEGLASRLLRMQCETFGRLINIPLCPAQRHANKVRRVRQLGLERGPVCRVMAGGEHGTDIDCAAQTPLDANV